MKYKILLLDNDVYACKYLCAILRSLNKKSENIFFETEFCTSAAQAIYQCINAQHSPDILLVDMELNDISGIRVIEEIRSRSDSIGIIGITSYSLSHYYDYLKEAGAQALISKNIKNEQLISVLVTVLNGLPYPDDKFKNVEDSYNYVIQKNKMFHMLNLTETEQKICIEYAQRYTPLEISLHLKINIATIYSHKRNILKKIKNVMSWEDLLCYYKR